MKEGSTLKTVILAGGLGTRLQEETTVKPKPMAEIGGQPILWHIMHIYASHGFQEFLVALGYKGEVIKDYFINYYQLRNSISVDLATGTVQLHEKSREDWKVHLVETGAKTETGGRLKRLEPWLRDETFFMTYGDGVANINLSELLEFHRAHGKTATVTAVRPSARFGALVLDGARAAGFAEKPQTGEGWINGGFFVLEPTIFRYLSGDHSVFEREPLETLAGEGQLMVYRHEGFWQCMDTLRDVRQLDALWQSGHAPWKVW